MAGRTPKNPAPGRSKTGRRKRKDAISTEEAAEFAARLLGSGMQKGEAKRAIMRKLKCGARTCETIITSARALLVRYTDRSAEDLRDASYQFYLAMSTDALINAKVRVAARKRLDALLGLDGPVRIDISGGLTHRAAAAVSGILKDEHAAKLLEQLDDMLASGSAAAAAAAEETTAEAAPAPPAAPAARAEGAA